MKQCVFAGTFDPFTIGHKDVVDKCLQMFDKVVVTVMNNQDKQSLFTAEERVDFIRRVYGDVSRVEVTCWEGLLVDFMRERGIIINVRGVRGADDFKYETNMFYYNSDMMKELITVYLPSPLERLHVSSTSIRSLINLGADISAYVPTESFAAIKQALQSKK